MSLPWMMKFKNHWDKMVSEALQPLVSELSMPEKRRLLEWLKNQVEVTSAPRVVNVTLREKLIKHIAKNKIKNGKNTTNNRPRSLDCSDSLQSNKAIHSKIKKPL